MIGNLPQIDKSAKDYVTRKSRGVKHFDARRVFLIHPTCHLGVTSMSSIQAIEQSSVHQIQSGQVIVDLNSVVKELVENSLDADATSIEVRFRNHGLEAIEVIDNGTGIAPEDFESVGKWYVEYKTCRD